LADFKASNPPAWTIHLIYCNNLTTDGIQVLSHGVLNGDGWNPDSSSNCYIINSTFDTGDDCIAIKAGKGLKGYEIGRPSNNIRITDCLFTRGHSLAMGSETGGGIENVFIQDCTVGNLNLGVQMKSHPTRGGYIRNITVRDCACKRITFLMRVPYNNDGKPAPVLPEFSNMSFSNLDMSKAAGNFIMIRGLPESPIKDIQFSNIICPQNPKARIYGADCDGIEFKNVKTADGAQSPRYNFKNSKNIFRD
jgi:polygalacturonase